jgi:hypothetical protein
MAYPPGSFTKNFAWHGKGFQKLHAAIRAGFKNKLEPVARADWRIDSSLTSGDFFVAANFFLHNVIDNGTNTIPIDELVRLAISEEHSLVFDRVALFGLNLSLGGKRTGANGGMEFPMRWGKEFVRERLWTDGRWQRQAFDVETMDAFFADRIEGVGRTKCRTNYRHLYELARFLPAAHAQINTYSESWIAPALFLAWDRRQMADGLFEEVDEEDLVEESLAEEDYKLVGVTESEFKAAAIPIAVQYANIGGLARFGAAVKTSGEVPAPEAGKSGPTPRETPNLEDLGWLTAAGTESAVERQVYEQLAQKRDQVAAAAKNSL